MRPISLIIFYSPGGASGDIAQSDTPSKCRAALEAETARWGNVVKASGIKPG